MYPKESKYGGAFHKQFCTERSYLRSLKKLKILKNIVTSYNFSRRLSEIFIDESYNYIFYYSEYCNTYTYLKKAL